MGCLPVLSSQTLIIDTIFQMCWMFLNFKCQLKLVNLDPEFRVTWISVHFFEVGFLNVSQITSRPSDGHFESVVSAMTRSRRSRWARGPGSGRASCSVLEGDMSGVRKGGDEWSKKLGQTGWGWEHHYRFWHKRITKKPLVYLKTIKMLKCKHIFIIKSKQIKMNWHVILMTEIKVCWCLSSGLIMSKQVVRKTFRWLTIKILNNR